MTHKPSAPLDKSQTDPELTSLREAGRDMMDEVRAEPVPESLRVAATALGRALDDLRAAEGVTRPEKQK